MARAKKKRKMTAATLSRLPVTAGSVVAGSLVRSSVWVLARLIDGGFWAVAQFMRAPVAVSAVAGIVGFSILAGSNALYFQTSRHPAPLFFPPGRAAIAEVKPVIPAPRPRLLPAAVDNETTGSVGPQPLQTPIGHDDVLALQKKLGALELFKGQPDGLFGRRTITAIKAFETKAGLTARGKLTRELLAAVTAYPLPEPRPMPAVAAAVAPAAPQPPANVVRPDVKLVATAKPAPIPGPARIVPLAPIQPAPPPVVDPVQTDAAPAQPADTFTANSLPVDPAPPVPAATKLAASAKPAPVVPQVAAPSAVAMSSASTAAGDTTVLAMNNPPAAAAPATPAIPAGDLTPAQKLAAQMGTLPPEATAGNAVPPASMASSDASVDPVLITKIQRGLASLGFLGAKIDGVPGEGTAKAIRNFEVFYDYAVTGQASEQLLSLLMHHGASI
jgi:peptidoglycan hydrolase-like protein with peptidoglycan-binding domain